jgi:hypothetical protein
MHVFGSTCKFDQIIPLDSFDRHFGEEPFSQESNYVLAYILYIICNIHMFLTVIAKTIPVT